MVKAAPAARKLAEELGVDIETVVPSKDNGFITMADVEGAAGVSSSPVENVRERPAEESRGALNHKIESDVKIGGMSFKKPGQGSLDHSTSKRLDIPTENLNNELHYHWATDDSGRVEQLRERRGYATVPNIKAENGDTITTRRRTGTNADGTPQYQQLMATPKTFREERMKKAEATRTFKEQGIIDSPTDERGNALNSGEYYMAQDSRIERK